MMDSLILKRAPVGDNAEDYSVLENDVVWVASSRPVAPQGHPWMWTSGHGGHIERAAHGFEGDARGRDGGVRQELAARVIRLPVSTRSTTRTRPPEGTRPLGSSGHVAQF